jgi:uncharacterized protein YjiK
MYPRFQWGLHGLSNLKGTAPDSRYRDTGLKWRVPNPLRRIPMTHDDEQTFSLTYLDRFDIADEDEGLTEPSALALSHGKNALWTVSDDTSKIFKMSLDGDLKKDDSFDIPDTGLEGIGLGTTGEFLVSVKEDGNEVIIIRIDSQEVINRRRLAEMTGFDDVAQYFVGSGENKGLEGITWNKETETLFVMKEGDPGLLIEVSPDLNAIRSHAVLNAENGFRDTEVDPDEIDFSDLCYQGPEHFWIISDKAKRLFLYDWKGNKVMQSAKLGYGHDGEYEEIEKAEGVAIDPDANRLYVVSDEEARLYVFDIRK